MVIVKKYCRLLLCLKAFLSSIEHCDSSASVDLAVQLLLVFHVDSMRERELSTSTRWIICQRTSARKSTNSTRFTRRSLETARLLKT